jgi:hypothetical protein
MDYNPIPCNGRFIFYGVY